MLKRQWGVLLLLAVLAGCAAGSGTEDALDKPDACLVLEPGDAWIHRYNAFIRTPPQFAVWIENEGGDFLDTLYVTEKTATEGWKANSGNRRVEALPAWMHRRGITAADGFLLPSRDEPLPDAVTGATPRSSPEITFSLPEGLGRFVLFLELNQSTDFNDAWPGNAVPGEPGWTGGPDGSGQPALLYRAVIDVDDRGAIELELIGHSSPDGSDGDTYADLSGFDSALQIIQTAVVYIG